MSGFFAMAASDQLLWATGLMVWFVFVLVVAIIVGSHAWGWFWGICAEALAHAKHRRAERIRKASRPSPVISTEAVRGLEVGE